MVHILGRRSDTSALSLRDLAFYPHLLESSSRESVLRKFQGAADIFSESKRQKTVGSLGLLPGRGPHAFSWGRIA